VWAKPAGIIDVGNPGTLEEDLLNVRVLEELSERAKASYRLPDTTLHILRITKWFVDSAMCGRLVFIDYPGDGLPNAIRVGLHVELAVLDPLRSSGS
jgi:hypothetical protein